MANKLKDLRLTSVDLVRSGANQEADICIYKGATPAEAQDGPTEAETNIFKRFLAWLRQNPTEDAGGPTDPIAKDSTTFDQLNGNRESRDKLWRYTDALTSSFWSILDDNDLVKDQKAEKMQLSLQQFTEAMTDLIGQLAGGAVPPANAVAVAASKSAPNYDEFPDYGMWLEENLDATIEEQNAAKEYYKEKKARLKKSASDFDEIEEVESVKKNDLLSVDLIEEVEKFNPYHDSRGRFSTSNSAASFTHRTRDPSKQHWADAAIAREKELDEKGLNGPSSKRKITDPKTIAGVTRGRPMTREEADKGKANPNFLKGGGYRTNCQSCVVAYEARRRGYDVTTKPNTRGSALDKLSRASHEAWIDPKTGKTPERPKPNEFVRTPKQCRNMLENTIQPGERYTFGHSWKGRSRCGHIICADKDDKGNLRLFDPQSGQTMMGKDIDGYLSRVKYTTTVYGMKINCSPRLLRVDNLSINPAYANDIMEAKTSA